MYFSFFKPPDCRKRSVVRGRGFIQRFPMLSGGSADRTGQPLAVLPLTDVAYSLRVNIPLTEPVWNFAPPAQNYARSRGAIPFGKKAWLFCQFIFRCRAPAWSRSGRSTRRRRRSAWTKAPALPSRWRRRIRRRGCRSRAFFLRHGQTRSLPRDRLRS